MKFIPRVISVFVLAAALISCSPTEPRVDHTPQIDAMEASLQPSLVFTGEEVPAVSLQERMEQLSVPGVSIAVILDGEIAWARGYGYADVANGVEVTPDTLFRAASISKPVAAMAALRFVQDGKVGLEEDVNAKLTSWSLPDHEWSGSSDVNLKGLLSHSAGTTVHGFPGYARDSEIPNTQGVLNGDGNTAPIVVDVEPGTLYRYSGGGYTVMQQLLMDIAGQSFPEIMRSTVLEPIGMHASTYEQPLPESMHAKAAKAYSGDATEVEGGWHVYPEMAAAGLWTTPSDLATFAISIQHAIDKNNHPVLNDAWINQMLTPVLEDHGLGPGIGDDTFGHGGANAGFRCNLRAANDGSWGLAVMTNGDNGGSLAREIGLTLAREYGWPGFEPREITLVTLETPQLEAIAGSYAIEGFGTVTLAVDGDRIAGVLPDESTFTLRSISEERFIDPEDGQIVRFEIEDGRAVALLVPGARGERVE